MRRLASTAAAVLALGAALALSGGPSTAAPASTGNALLAQGAIADTHAAGYRRGHWKKRKKWRRYGYRYRGWPRAYGYRRGWRAYGYRRGPGPYSFRGGYSPYGCYFDEGSGRFYSCDAGGRR